TESWRRRSWWTRRRWWRRIGWFRWLRRGIGWIASRSRGDSCQRPTAADLAERIHDTSERAARCDSSQAYCAELAGEQFTRAASQRGIGECTLKAADARFVELDELHRHKQTPFDLRQFDQHAIDLDHLVVLHGERVHVVVVRKDARRDALVL